MKLSILSVALLAAIVSASAASKAPVKSSSARAATAVAQSPLQAARKVLKQERMQARKEVAAEQASTAKAIGDEVGDLNSFGRNVQFIGLMNTGSIQLATDCTPDPDYPPGPEDHCIVVAPAGASTLISLQDVARVVIPGKSANSMFCHWQTPFVVYSFFNETAAYLPNARFILTPTYKIENPVLNDAGLIDPSTGLPMGGSFSTALPGIRRARGLQPGEFQTERENGTRVCNVGLVSRASLISVYGLSDAQADKFFKKDTIITMGLEGSSRAVDFASIVYGTRFVGDARD